MRELEFVRKWANGEILTNTAPADRHQLKKLIAHCEDLEKLIKASDDYIAALTGHGYFCHIDITKEIYQKLKEEYGGPT